MGLHALLLRSSSFQSVPVSIQRWVSLQLAKDASLQMYWSCFIDMNSVVRKAPVKCVYQD